MTLSGLFASSTLRRDSRSAVEGGFTAHVSSDYAEVETLWEQLAQEGAALPFQRRCWLSHWYDAHRATHKPLLITIERAGAPVMALPLAMSRRGSLRIIHFADAGVTDYNAPILGGGAPDDAAGAASIMHSLLQSLPPADLLSFDKMPKRVEEMINPLALAPTATVSALNGNVLHAPSAWEDWHYGLERRFRKELERSLRVFSKFDGAQFRRFENLEEAAPVYAVLQRQQGERIRALGLPYILDKPEHKAFYDALVAEELPRGATVLTALMAKEEVVAALLGVTDGRRYVMVRLSTGGERWKNCSPGRLLIERTMKVLHEEGHRAFDFTIGDYAYKRRMGVTTTPLHNLTMALGWRGQPEAALARLRAEVRARPSLLCLAKKLSRVKRSLAARRT